MLSFEGLNEMSSPNDVATNLENLSDVVGETKIVGFEQIADVNNDVIKDFLEDNVPIEHLKDCPEIKYAPDSSFFKAFPKALGAFYATTNQIEIAEVRTSQTVSDVLDIVTREVGHSAFEQLDDQESNHWSEIYDSLTGNEPGFGFVSDCSKDSPSEDFAESYRCYINDPDLLKFMSPAKYEFMKNIVFNGREYGALETADGGHLVVNRGIADVMNQSMDVDESLNDDLVSISDGASPVSDTFRCFTMVS